MVKLESSVSSSIRDLYLGVIHVCPWFNVVMVTRRNGQNTILAAVTAVNLSFSNTRCHTNPHKIACLL